MDIRNQVCAILVGGTPAPGINGVISAVVLECFNNNITVIGIRDGFKHLRKGITHDVIHRFERSDVTGLYCQGGSMLRTSREIPTNKFEVDNCLRCLEHWRVRYLVTIGGTITAYCASLMASAASAGSTIMKFSVVHVPKSIFNDLPLPHNATTFGFATAREVGTQILRNLKQDSRTMQRWYVVVVMGQKAGHLTLGIGKAGSATLTLIPEQFKDKVCTFAHVCDILEGSIVKRMAMGRYYGVACLSEGLVDRMDPAEVKERWGSADNAHQEIGRDMVKEVKQRLASRNTPMTMFSRNLGNELRAADPNATDTDLAQDLGYGALRFLLDGGNGCMVAIKGGRVNAIRLDKIIDRQNARTQIRLVDTDSLRYAVAQTYQVRLTPEDFKDKRFLYKLARCANMEVDAFVAQFAKAATPTAQATVDSPDLAASTTRKRPDPRPSSDDQTTNGAHIVPQVVPALLPASVPVAQVNKADGLE